MLGSTRLGGFSLKELRRTSEETLCSFIIVRHETGINKEMPMGQKGRGPETRNP